MIPNNARRESFVGTGKKSIYEIALEYPSDFGLIQVPNQDGSRNDGDDVAQKYFLLCRFCGGDLDLGEDGSGSVQVDKVKQHVNSVCHLNMKRVAVQQSEIAFRHMTALAYSNLASAMGLAALTGGMGIGGYPGFMTCPASMAAPQYTFAGVNNPYEQTSFHHHGCCPPCPPPSSGGCCNPQQEPGPAPATYARPKISRPSRPPQPAPSAMPSPVAVPRIRLQAKEKVAPSTSTYAASSPYVSSGKDAPNVSNPSSSGSISMEKFKYRRREDQVDKETESEGSPSSTNSRGKRKRSLPVRLQRPVAELFRMSWTHPHLDRNKLALYQLYLSTGVFFDAFLCCEGNKIPCHKAVLSASSSYLDEFLRENLGPDPVIYVDKQIMNYNEALVMIQFMYRGELILPAPDIQRMFEAAEKLCINGLTMEVVAFAENNPGTTLEEIQAPVTKATASVEGLVERMVMMENENRQQKIRKRATKHTSPAEPKVNDNNANSSSTRKKTAPVSISGIINDFFSIPPASKNESAETQPPSQNQSNEENN